MPDEDLTKLIALLQASGQLQRDVALADLEATAANLAAVVAGSTDLYAMLCASESDEAQRVQLLLAWLAGASAAVALVRCNKHDRGKTDY